MVGTSGSDALRWALWWPHPETFRLPHPSGSACSSTIVGWRNERTRVGKSIVKNPRGKRQRGSGERAQTTLAKLLALIDAAADENQVNRIIGTYPPERERYCTQRCCIQRPMTSRT